MDILSAHHALFDRLPDVVYFSKDTEGRYTHANQTLLLRLGLPDLRALKGKKLLVTLENHGLTGGLADLVDAALREQKARPPHLALGYPEEIVPHGSISDIENMYGLSPAKIAARIRKNLK